MRWKASRRGTERSRCLPRCNRAACFRPWRRHIRRRQSHAGPRPCFLPYGARRAPYRPRNPRRSGWRCNRACRRPRTDAEPRNQTARWHPYGRRASWSIHQRARAQTRYCPCGMRRSGRWSLLCGRIPRARSHWSHQSALRRPRGRRRAKTARRRLEPRRCGCR